MRFYSNENNFFNDRELALLTATDDISFALEMMERDNTLTDIRRVTDALQNFQRKLNLLNNLIRHDILNTITGLLGLEDMALTRIPDRVGNGLLLEIKDSTRTDPTADHFHPRLPECWRTCPAMAECAGGRVFGGKVCKPGSVRLSVMPDEGFEIFADAMLEKVFYNLIDNALRYGGKLSEVTLTLKQAGSCLAITCRDDGLGIVNADKEKIFCSGFGTNTGQGLFLAREILGISGITIKETGLFGQGARFEITVPEGAWQLTEDHKIP